MIAEATTGSLEILDEFGNPFKSAAKKRRAVAEFMPKRRPIRARYDAERGGKEYERVWENTDRLDADSANSRVVRERLVQRSRYEAGNNGYAAGIANTYATDLIGKGPKLRMQTGSEGFNRMVEEAFHDWAKETRLARKLWVMARAKHVDGEAFGVMRANRRLMSPVKLDLVLHETEQCQSLYIPYSDRNYIDGIKFDEQGNPLWYDFLREHPGSNTRRIMDDLDPEQVPARYVCHWFKQTRPGQHRGIPETTPTLNIGVSARRWREAVVSAAENIADYSLFLKTTFEPYDGAVIDPFDSIDIEKRMMVALPEGYDAFQPKAEQPTSTHAEFSKSLLQEQARPHSMPYNKAACDSSSYNYASGRLDHQTYYAHLDVERCDCDLSVLDVLFSVWFEFAVVANGWLGGNPLAIGSRASRHMWDWPKHQVADIKAEAEANDKRLKNGTASLVETYAKAGEDYEDELIKQATANGTTVEIQRQVNFLLNVPPNAMPYVAKLMGLETGQQAPMAEPSEENEESDDEE